MSNEVLLKLDHITKTYADGGETHTVLDDVSLRVNRGELVAIVGPSGSGKTTLLTIAGMLLTPDAGTVTIAGEEMTGAKKSHMTAIRRDHVGFVFQSHQLLPYLKSRDQLLLMQSRENRGRISADDLLSDLGVQSCSGKYPSRMSGGEKQRVAIARAFINDPDIILADEPTASLDAARGRQVVEMIQKEVKKRRKAAVMVTHDERVLDLADRVLHLIDGRLE